jgi:hypothetical protein
MIVFWLDRISRWFWRTSSAIAGAPEVRVGARGGAVPPLARSGDNPEEKCARKRFFGYWTTRIEQE